MPEKIAIATLNYGYKENKWYKYLRDQFIPSIRDYAKRINADFILMNNNNNRFIGTWNQLQFLDYLSYYDRIAYIDGDCYIPKYCYHNFFNNVPTNNIGLYEYVFSEIKQCNNTFVVMVLDKQYKNLFAPPPVSEQENKYISYKGFCLMGKQIDNIHNRCYQREECYINECINRYKLNKFITHLTNLKTKYHNYFLTSSMIYDKSNCFYHIQSSAIKNEIKEIVANLKKEKIS